MTVQHEGWAIGDPIVIHDVIRPHQPVAGTYAGATENHHWLVDVGDAELHLVAHPVVDRVERVELPPKAQKL